MNSPYSIKLCQLMSLNGGQTLDLSCFPLKFIVCVTLGHSILIDIPFWVIIHFERHPILSDIPCWVMRSEGSEESEGLSICNLRVSEWVNEWVLIIRTRNASISKRELLLLNKKTIGNWMYSNIHLGYVNTEYI